MEQNLFDDLMQSLKEAQAIAKGAAQASRRFDVSPPDVKAVREQTAILNLAKSPVIPAGKQESRPWTVDCWFRKCLI